MATRENAWEKNTVQKLWVEEHRAQHQANLNEFTGAGQNPQHQSPSCSE